MTILCGRLVFHGHIYIYNEASTSLVLKTFRWKECLFSTNVCRNLWWRWKQRNTMYSSIVWRRPRLSIYEDKGDYFGNVDNILVLLCCCYRIIVRKFSLIYSYYIKSMRSMRFLCLYNFWSILSPDIYIYIYKLYAVIQL